MMYWAILILSPFIAYLITYKLSKWIDHWQHYEGQHLKEVWPK